MSDRRVYVVGSINADHRMRVARIPSAGETVLGDDVVVAAGGKGANQAVAAARAGAHVSIVGAIGDDGDGALLRETLAADEIDVRHVHVRADRPTGRAMITVDDHGENTIVVSPGANADLTTDDVDSGLQEMRPGDLLLLQLETPAALVSHAAKTAAAAGGTVILNAAPVPSTAGSLLAHVDILVVNEHELAGLANLLSGNESEPGAMMSLLAGAADASVVCTAGAAGVTVLHAGRSEHLEAVVVDAVDTTGAGDTFIGYLAAKLTADPDDLVGALGYAVRAAAIAVTRPGAIDAIPYVNEIDTAATKMTTKGSS
jgi:ribokinase